MHIKVGFELKVHHLNWIENYQAIRKAIGIEWPGYLLHESATWSPILRKWYFLPRRCSKERYNETKVCSCSMPFFFVSFVFIWLIFA